MCEFVGWIEKGRKVYFLTRDLILNTPQGELLRKKYNSERLEDFNGHNAIRDYFGLRDGTDKEQADFSSSENFPPEIVQAIKAGQMQGFGWSDALLSRKGLKQRDASTECMKARTKWKKAKSEWKKAAIKLAKIDNGQKRTADEWDKATDEWKRTVDEWEKSTDEWKRIADEIGWMLFAIPEKRNPAWR